MKKTTILYRLLLVFTIFVFQNSASLSFASDLENQNVYHIVICWLKDSKNESNRIKLIQATKKLQSIPGVISIQVGNMLPSKRAIVDSTYDIGIIMSFKDQNAMSEYLKNPMHQQATKEILAPLTSRVVVYDFVVAE